MGLDLPAFADAEEVFVTLLTPVAAQVVKATATQITPPVVVVRRVGGRSDYVTDFPQVEVRALDATRQASMQLQLQCQRLVQNAFCTEVTLADGTVVLVDGTQTLTSGHVEPYENVDLREVTAVYELRMRRPISVPN